MKNSKYGLQYIYIYIYGNVEILYIHQSSRTGISYTTTPADKAWNNEDVYSKIISIQLSPK